MEPHIVSMDVVTNDPSTMAKVSEQFARTLAGLAMEGVYGTLYIYDPEKDEED